MQDFVINGGKKLSGSIAVNTSKNAAVALLAASCLNRGVTTLKGVPQIEEVNRWLEILDSIGMKIEKLTADGRNIKLTPPRKFSLDHINKEAACKTRSVILLLGALAHREKDFDIPQAGGCHLGSRTITPHAHALEQFGIDVSAEKTSFAASRKGALKKPGRFALLESGDTVTENALFAAAQSTGVTEIVMATANYMVQDTCFFLQKCGVRIDGIGTTTLTVHGVGKIDADVTYDISEDPIEAMFFISLAVATKSKLKITRCPIEFIELELTKLKAMGLEFSCSKKYKAKNRKTQLIDLTIESSKITALPDKIEARPFPGLNIDNLPFFAVIAGAAKGTTLIHDWVYENRAIYLQELKKLGAKVNLLDPHRITIEGPVKWKSRTMTCPPALRPGAVFLVAMLAAKGASRLKNVYMINRGYENLAPRLRSIGADIVVEES